MIKFTLITLVLFVGLLSGCDDKVKEQKNAVNTIKPNIIFILTDDQRWDALGFAGNPISKRPIWTN